MTSQLLSRSWNRHSKTHRLQLLSSTPSSPNERAGVRTFHSLPQLMSLRLVRNTTHRLVRVKQTPWLLQLQLLHRHIELLLEPRVCLSERRWRMRHCRFMFVRTRSLPEHIWNVASLAGVLQHGQQGPALPQPSASGAATVTTHSGEAAGAVKLPPYGVIRHG